MTNNEFDVLEAVAHMESCGFTGMFTGRRYRRRDAERCVKAGWLEPKMLVACDGDGFHLEPERERGGYVLTEAGRQALKRERARREQVSA